MSKQYHIQCGPGDVGRYVLLPGDPGRAEKIASLFDEHWKVAANREHTTFTGYLDGEKVSVTSTGMGCPSTAIAVEELAKVGADTFIRVGTAGARQKYIEIGELIIATAAIRDEGTSRQYIPVEYPAVASMDVTSALVTAAQNARVPYRVGILHTKDSFYSQAEPERIPLGPEILARREAFMKGHALASEMEASTLFVVSSILQCRAGAVVKILNNRLRKPFDTDEGFRTDLSDLLRVAVDAVRLLIQRDKLGSQSKS